MYSYNIRTIIPINNNSEHSGTLTLRLQLSHIYNTFSLLITKFQKKVTNQICKIRTIIFRPSVYILSLFFLFHKILFGKIMLENCFNFISITLGKPQRKLSPHPFLLCCRGLRGGGGFTSSSIPFNEQSRGESLLKQKDFLCLCTYVSR